MNNQDEFDRLLRRSPWYILIRAHDHLWNDRAAYSILVRFEAMQELHVAAIKVCEKMHAR
jgi:hypothetical protein